MLNFFFTDFTVLFPKSLPLTIVLSASIRQILFHFYNLPIIAELFHYLDPRIGVDKLHSQVFFLSLMKNKKLSLGRDNEK